MIKSSLDSAELLNNINEGIRILLKKGEKDKLLEIKKHIE